MATDPAQVTVADDQKREQVCRAEAVRQLLASWLADESGYDERVWPQVRRGLEEARTSSRPLFDD